MYSYVALLCCKGTCQTVFSFILFFQEQGCAASCYTGNFQNAYTPEDRPGYYNLHIIIILLIGYRVQATTIRGPNTVKCFCSNAVLLTDGQNTCDQFMQGRRLKRAWSSCILGIPFILSGRPNKCWPHTCDTCVITTQRLGLRAPLVDPNNERLTVGDTVTVPIHEST